MAKFKKITGGTPDGWSDWQSPIQGYKMACCDCGLSHDMEFRIIEVDYQDGPDWSGKDVPWGKYRVLIRARRNNRSTAALRREDKRRKEGEN